MLLHTFILGLVVSVAATARPRDDTLEPELIATPSNFANATELQSFIDPRSLHARQLFCNTGYHACSNQGCCPNTEYCVVISGKLGCCPNGRVCNLPPIGPPRCTNSGYFLCPSQEYCCPSGSVCTRDSNNNPTCEGNSSPPPTTNYVVGTSTDTYTITSNCGCSTAAIEITSAYIETTSAYIETTSAYTSFPSPNPTTATSTNSSSSGSSTFSINNAATTSSRRSGNDPVSSAQKTVPGYSVTGVMLLLVFAGFI